MSEIWPSYAVDEKIDGGIHNCEKASDEIKDPLKGWSKIEIDTWKTTPQVGLSA